MKLLILVVAYEASAHIADVLQRTRAVLPQLPEGWSAEVLVSDDGSKDNTTDIAKAELEKLSLAGRAVKLAVNQGYGGNQKAGYAYAIQHGCDAVILLHGDGQYAPELMPKLLMPFADDGVEAVFGSRMTDYKQARAGGMPLYKMLGNIALTKLQNKLLGSSLSEFHSGYRIYRTRALAQIPFLDNANWFDFDTDIIIQLVRRGLRIHEVPIPTHYGDEVCRVNSVKYSQKILHSTLLSCVPNIGQRVKKFDDARSWRDGITESFRTLYTQTFGENL